MYLIHFYFCYILYHFLYVSRKLEHLPTIYELAFTNASINSVFCMGYSEKKKDSGI